MRYLIWFLLILSPELKAQPSGYRIVFNVLEDREKDNYEVYSMNMDGTDRRNITQTPGVEWVYYAWQDKVYFVSDADTCHRCYFLYEMDAFGNNKRKVSELQLEDSWMGSRNEGKEMIVLGRQGKIRAQLYLVDIQSGNYRLLGLDTISTKRDPIFLPDGKNLVLAYRPDKSLRKTVPDELWKISFDGQTKQQLSFFPASDTSTQWFEYHAGPPQWNKKHRFISYLSRRNGQHQIFAVSEDGKKHWQITSGELGSGWHSWSSDGKWLVMDKADPQEKSYDIYLMNYQTKKTVRLTTDPKYEQAPVIVAIRK